MIYPLCIIHFYVIMYAYVLSYVRFNLKVRSQGLLKLLKLSVLSVPVLDGIVVTTSLFALSCR